MNTSRSGNQKPSENRVNRYRQTRFIRWLARACLTVLCCALVALAGVQLQASSAREFAGLAGTPDFAQRLVTAANEAFAYSATGGDWAAQRRGELPSSPVTGLTTVTAAGPVQLVLPSGLGDAMSTPEGVVVYPDNGAGVDMLAEHTGSGIRTVARIVSAEGVRMVTTFVRTPADTVVLAHANGYLTINRATPTAETIGMFAPAETRDAAGKLVPSSYVVRQIRPGLYQLSEVIDSAPDTMWPVYADRSLNTAGPGGAPLPQFGFSDLTGAMSSAVSATVSGAQAVGTFVKDNPLETAIIVAGAAVAVTGVGGPAGAAAIAAAVAEKFLTTGCRCRPPGQIGDTPLWRERQ
jgi:hypothetical protein